MPSPGYAKTCSTSQLRRRLRTKSATVSAMELLLVEGEVTLVGDAPRRRLVSLGSCWRRKALSGYRVSSPQGVSKGGEPGDGSLLIKRAILWVATPSNMRSRAVQDLGRALPDRCTPVAKETTSAE